LWLHIGEHNPEAADRYIWRIQETCETVAQFPDRGTSRPDLGEHCHKLVTGDYVVFYDHPEENIIILWVFHDKEAIDPSELIKLTLYKSTERA
jgi:toxin ParE1/3/4